MKFLSSALVILLFCSFSLNANPKTYEDVAKNWRVYVDSLNKKLKAKGMLPYEEKLNQALLEIMSPVSNVLDKYQKGKKEEKEQIHLLTRQRLEMITILENEIKRAENIRLLFAKMKRAGDIKSLAEINKLQEESIKIRETQLKLAEFNKSYVSIYSNLNADAQKLIDVKKSNP
jgi:hypothetical protein